MLPQKREFKPSSRSYKGRAIALLALAVALAALALPFGSANTSARSGNSEGQEQRQKEFGFRPEIITVSAPEVGDPLTAPTGAAPLETVREFVAHNGGQLRASSADVSDLKLVDQYTDEHNGVTHIYLRQQIDGIEVLHADVAAHVLRDGSLLNMSSSLIRNLGTAARTRAATLTQEQAVQSAARHLGLSVASLQQSLRREKAEEGPEQKVIFNRAGISLDPIPARLIYQPVAADAVRLAWNVEIAVPSGDHHWRLSVDAVTGEVLAGYDYVIHDEWAGVRPDVERNQHLSSNMSSSARSVRTAASAPVPPVAVNDGSAYHVFPIPFESPTDGAQATVTNPADALASPYGWHDTNGAAGPEFTVTRGNNVHAYTDVTGANPTAPTTHVECGPSLQCIQAFDPTKGPADNRPPAVVNLFYWNNIVHDVYYRYGFHELAGNFQVNNYNRGPVNTSGVGVGHNDDVRAEAQDGSGTNNANFSTNVDGNRPRMQMYVWTYPFANVVSVNTPASIAGGYAASPASFGPAITAAGTTGDLVIALDAADTAGPSTTDGCSTITNPLDVAGKIAVMDRGTCGFPVKVKNAQLAGAIAAIIVNNVSGDPVSMGGTDATITIPSVMVTLAHGTLFKENLPVNVTLQPNPNPPPNRDSDFDAGIIAHEYGHGISNRLTGGRTNTSCLGNQEQMGEGWSDWLGLVLTSHPSDTATTPRGVGTYVIWQSEVGKGIRPTQYSYDMTVNPSTYDTIKTAAVPHGVGYVWATMMWDMYWNLVQKHGYNPNVYEGWQTGGNNLAIQLVMDGMKLQPCSPGFVSGRNAIIQADQALTGGANACEIWSAFARRGLGVSASQGATSSVTDGTQAFDLPAACTAPTATSIVTAAASGTYGGTTTLSATLSSGGTGLSGQTVAFTLNGNSVGNATTNASGVATLTGVSLSGINAGSYPSGVGAGFAAGGGYAASNSTASLTVNKATPVITWSNPADIDQGTALSSTQLNASANTPGSFSYNPAAGTVLPAGTHTLNVDFTPTDATNFNGSSASVSINVNAVAAALSITNVPEGTTFDLGKIYSYTVSVPNTGNASATGVVVSYPLPAGLSYNSVNASQGNCSFSSATSTVTCQLGTIAGGASASFVLKVKSRQEGTYSPTASYTSNAGTGSATAAQVTIVKYANLAVTKVDSVDPIYVGQQTTYTMTVKNLGPINSATGTALTDTLPSGMVFVSATTTQGSVVTPPVDSGGIVTANLGTLALNATATVTVTVKATQAGTLVNTATVSSSEVDSNTSNNTATQSTRVLPAVTLQKVLLSNHSPIGGCQPFPTGQVFLTSPAPAGGVTVNLSSTNAGVVVPAGWSAFIAAGQTKSEPFTVTTQTVTRRQDGNVVASFNGSTVVRSLQVYAGSCPP